MISTINLYYKTIMTGNEINDIIAYYVLSKKINAQSFSPQMLPEVLFRKSCILSISTSIFPQLQVSVGRRTLIRC